MRGKAIIFDLGNTIYYSAAFIGGKLFYALFQRIDNEGRYLENINALKH
jgi:FMN phosphatase YigB (HAD superfamily)